MDKEEVVYTHHDSTDLDVVGIIQGTLTSVILISLMEILNILLYTFWMACSLYQLPPIGVHVHCFSSLASVNNSAVNVLYIGLWQGIQRSVEWSPRS